MARIVAGVASSHIPAVGAAWDNGKTGELEMDRLWMRMVDGAGQPIPAPFNRILLIPDPETPAEFAPAVPFVDESQGTVAFTQILPALPPENYDPTTGDPGDRAFRLCARVGGH